MGSESLRKDSTVRISQKYITTKLFFSPENPPQYFCVTEYSGGLLHYIIPSGGNPTESSRCCTRACHWEGPRSTAQSGIGLTEPEHLGNVRWTRQMEVRLERFWRPGHEAFGFSLFYIGSHSGLQAELSSGESAFLARALWKIDCK